jgi:iron complex transport system permease protein
MIRSLSDTGQKRIFWAALIFVVSAILLPWIGAEPLSAAKVFRKEAPDYEILIELRESRTLLALVAGGALSLAGALFQAMLREALATPDTLGISAGASLGAVFAITVGKQLWLGIPATWVGALAGASTVLVLVMGSSLGKRQISAFGLLLSGIAINSVCSALVIVLHSFSGVSRSFSIAHWLIGSVDSVSYWSLGIFSVVVFATSCYVVLQAKSWNLIAVGEQWAASRGARVDPLLRGGYIAGAILVASTIVLTGPLAFVGLIVPHLVRSRISADHRILLPCAFLLGGVLLAVCDTTGRLLLPPAELPAGAVLALIGGPYLVWLIRQRLRPEEA